MAETLTTARPSGLYAELDSLLLRLSAICDHEGGERTSPKLKSSSSALPIRQSLLALRGLRAEPKALLIEVCELFENGGKHKCYATNSYLAARLGIHPKNVSRLLSGLVDGGWLTRVLLPEKGNHRRLEPTAQTRHYYQPILLPGLASARSENAVTPEVKIGSSPKEDDLLPKLRTPISSKCGDLSTSKKEYTTDIQEQELARLRASLLKEERLAQRLRAEVATLKAQLHESSHTTESAREVQVSPEELKQFSAFQAWAKAEAPTLLRMKEPLTGQQFNALTKEFTVQAIKEVGLAMHNYPPLLAKSRSTNLTMRNWLRRRLLSSVLEQQPTRMAITQVEKIKRQNQPIY